MRFRLREGVRLTSLDNLTQDLAGRFSAAHNVCSGYVAALHRGDAVRFVDRVFATALTGTARGSLPLNVDAFDLMWDGFVEVWHASGWVSGDDAIALLGPFGDLIDFRSTREAEASWDAISYASRCLLQRPAAISDVLYRHGQMPVGSGAASSCERVATFADDLLAKQGWGRISATRYWYRWYNSRVNCETALYKMYVSACLEAPVLQSEPFWSCVAASSAAACKMVSPFASLGRIDALCIYFPNWPELERFQKIISQILLVEDTRAVPLALAFIEPGPVSWGLDPASHNKSPQSWRSILADVVADAIVRNGSVLDPSGRNWKRIAFAVKDIGIDPFTWRPGVCQNAMLQMD